MSNQDNQCFRILDIDVSDTAEFPNAIREIYERTIDGMIIRNVFDRDAVARIVEQLRTTDLPFPRASYEWGQVYGRVLFAANPDMDGYFQDAGQFRAACKSLFSQTADFETRVTDVLGSLAGGLPVIVPESEGRGFTPATIRFMEPGRGLAIHRGNQFMSKLKLIQPLADAVDYEDQMSYFVVLDEADEGGELVLHELDLSDRRPEQMLANSKKMRLRPRAGDLLLFQGGQIWHEVAQVNGSRSRVTIGGFLAYSPDHSQIAYWS